MSEMRALKSESLILILSTEVQKPRIGFSGPRAWGYRQARFGDEPFFRALLT
jgi:hypothetical protein